MAVKLSMAFPAVVCEGRPVPAIGRSWELTKENWWRVFGTLLVVFLLLLVITLALGPVLGRRAAGLGLDERGRVRRPDHADRTADRAITYPLWAAVLTVMYYDLRVRNEGFDLQLLAQGVGADTSRFETSPERPDSSPPPSRGRRLPPAGGARHLLVTAPRRDAARGAVAGGPLGRRRRRSGTSWALAERAAAAPPPASSCSRWRPSMVARWRWARHLEGASGDELERRARLLAAASTAADEATNRRRSSPEAQEVLERAPLPRRRVPAPVRRPAGVAGRADGARDRVDRRPRRDRPRRPGRLWTLLAAGRAAGAATFTGTTIRRRALAIERARAAAMPAAEDPRALEREAERAERDGDWERAVRLRFRAGPAAARPPARDRLPAVADHRRGGARDRLAGLRRGRRALRRDRLRRPARPSARTPSTRARGWAEVLA